MIVQGDPAFGPPELLNLTEAINEVLGSIGSTGRCVAVCQASVRHPSATKRAKAHFTGVSFLVAGLDRDDYASEGDFISNWPAITKDAERGFELKLEEIANGIFDDNYQMPIELGPRARWFPDEGDANWDWLVRATVQDDLPSTRVNIPSVIASQPLQSKRGTSSHFLVAFMSTRLESVLDLDFLAWNAPFRRNEAPWWACQSLEEAVVFKQLSDAHYGSATRSEQREPTDLLRQIAAGLMEFHAASACEWGWSRHDSAGRPKTRKQGLPSLFEWCSRMSHQVFEDRPLVGQLFLSSQDKRFRRVAFTLKKAVRCDKERAVGKLISASSNGSFPMLAGFEISQFGCYVEPKAWAKKQGSHRERIGATVEFLGRGRFRWTYRGRNVLEVNSGQPRLIRPVVTEAQFAERFRQCFPKHDHQALWAIVKVVVGSSGGATLIISAAAAVEAVRLGGCFPVEPFLPNMEQLRAFAQTDGGVLVDPKGVMVAFGVLLDGVTAADRGDPSRGSRYNSAVRYSAAHAARTNDGTGLLIVVVSQDGMVDLVSSLSHSDQSKSRKWS